MILADRIVAAITIVACLSVTKCIVALRVGVGVERCTVVNPGGNVLFTSSGAFVVGCIVQPQHSTKKRTAEISASLE